MPYQLEFTDATIDDYLASEEWQESRGYKFVAEFIQELELTLDLLTENPNLFQKVADSIRRAPLNKSKYNLFYVVSEDDQHIIILAIVPQRADSNNWPRF